MTAWYLKFPNDLEDTRFGRSLRTGASSWECLKACHFRRCVICLPRCHHCVVITIFMLWHTEQPCTLEMTVPYERLCWLSIVIELDFSVLVERDMAYRLLVDWLCTRVVRHFDVRLLIVPVICPILNVYHIFLVFANFIVWRQYFICFSVWKDWPLNQISCRLRPFVVDFNL